MRYWWVNQNQTYRHEVPGGYLWSPKRKQNGHRNPFYEFMREVSPGDLVFSFADTYIKAIGIVGSYAYEAPKPLEFGLVGAYWDQIGWRVDVRFYELRNPAKPADAMDRLARFLPRLYSPLQANGEGMQGVYLTELSDAFALELVEFLGREARSIMLGTRVEDADMPKVGLGLIEWEEHELALVNGNPAISETTRTAVVQARRGQGLFKQRVMQIESKCRLTGVDRPEHLRASHCKPWRDGSNDERLDGENGLLLTPDADHLFDRGFLSFEDGGRVLISPVAHVPSLQKMGLSAEHLSSVGSFTEGQRRYLAFHRENVFLQARLRKSAT